MQKVGSVLRLRAAQNLPVEIQAPEYLECLNDANDVDDIAYLARLQSAENSTWLNYLLAAAQQFTDCEESERRSAHQLMNLGRRWSSFLHSGIKIPAPLFGLARIKIFLSVLRNDQQRVRLLRNVCTQLKLRESWFLRLYQSFMENPRTEYASLVPAQPSLQKRMLDGRTARIKTCPLADF